MGGYWSIRITSIRLIQDNKCFELIVGALYCLDNAISRSIYGIKWDNKFIGIIRHLFDVKKAKNGEDIMKYDNYIYSTFDCFVKQKRKMMLRMGDLEGCYTDLRNLIFGEIKKIDASDDIARMKTIVNGADDDNLPKQELLIIFDNVQELMVHLFHRGYFYPISLLSLLSIIKSHPSMEMVNIYLGSAKHNDLIRSLYSLSSSLKAKYKNAGYSIHLREVLDDYGANIVCEIRR